MTKILKNEKSFFSTDCILDLDFAQFVRFCKVLSLRKLKNLTTPVIITVSLKISIRIDTYNPWFS